MKVEHRPRLGLSGFRCPTSSLVLSAVYLPSYLNLTALGLMTQLAANKIGSYVCPSTESPYLVGEDQVSTE